MFSDSFLGATSKLIQKKIDVIKDSMTSGSLGSMEEYRYSVGKLFAYQECMALLKETYSKFFEEITIDSRRDENGFKEQKY